MSNESEGATERPEWFDRKLVDNIDAIRRAAVRRRRNAADVDDLVQDTIAYSLDKWKTHEPWDTFGGWLAHNVKHVSHRQFRKSQTQKRDDSEYHPIDYVESSQEDYAEIDKIRDKVNEREYNALLLRGAGFEYEEIGPMIGCKREYARRTVRKARIKLGVNV